MQTLAEGVRETVRAYVENGLRDGVGPATIARQIAMLQRLPSDAVA